MAAVYPPDARRKRDMPRVTSCTTDGDASGRVKLVQTPAHIRKFANGPAYPRPMRRVVRAIGIVATALLVAGACEGSWNKTANPSPVRAVHAALLRTGK